MNIAGFDKNEQTQQKKSQKNQKKNKFTQNSSPPKKSNSIDQNFIPSN